MLLVSILVKPYSVGAKRLSTGIHKISGEMLQLQADKKPSPSELQHAITFNQLTLFDRRVVRVEGLLPEWDEDVLNLAFDDEDEGGGEIEENGIQIKGDEALITFKDPEGMNTIVALICQIVQNLHTGFIMTIFIDDTPPINLYTHVQRYHNYTL